MLSGQHLSGNYRYGSSLNNAASYTFTQQALPDSIYTQTQQANSVSNKIQHSFSVIYELSLDSSSSFRFSFGGITEKGHNQDAFTDSTKLNSILVNSGTRTSDALIENRSIIGNILWRKKFNRPGQTFSANASLAISNQNTYGFLYARNQYYQEGGSPQFADTVDQRKDINNITSAFNGNILYTSAVGKGWEMATEGYKRGHCNHPFSTKHLE